MSYLNEIKSLLALRLWFNPGLYYMKALLYCTVDVTDMSIV